MMESPHHVDIHVGRKLWQRREDYNISQFALGTAIGVTYQQIQKYEKAHDQISASRLYMIAKPLGVEVSYFFDGLP